MPIYLVETYLTLGTVAVRAEREGRARTAADELTRAGAPVRFAGSIYLPVDEICYFAFAAETKGEAEEAAQRAALDPLRVVKAVTSAISFGGTERKNGVNRPPGENQGDNP